MALNPAPERQTVLTFVSPKVADILFFERRDANLPKNQNPPAYGTSHPDSAKWPDHELVYITKADESGWQNWYYAARREDQDDYNYEISYPYAGLTDYPRYTRTYVEKRALYEKVEKGTADPDITGAVLVHEEVRRIDAELDSLYVAVTRIYDAVASTTDQDTYNYSISYPYNSKTDFPRYTRTYVIPRADYSPLASGTADPVDAGATLVSQVVTRISDPIADELYVMVTRTFDTIPDITDVTDAAVLATFGYRIQRPYGTSAHFRLIWSFPIALSAYAAEAENSTCPITGYTSLVLTGEEVQDEKDAEDLAVVTRVYDTIPGLELDDVSTRIQASIPDRFIVTATLTKTRQRVADGTAPDTPAGSPLDLAGALVESSVDTEGESGVVNWLQGLTSKITTDDLEGEELDQMTGAMLPITIELVAAGTSGQAVDSLGIYKEVEPLNTAFSIRTTRKATSLAGTSRTYYTIINYQWPAVLESITFTAVDKYLVEGGGDTYVAAFRYDVQTKDAYSGPCKATVTESWSDTAPAQEVPTIMIPKAIEWDFTLSQGRIGPTLHDAFNITETIGSNHPQYPTTVNTKAIAATNYTDWPATIIGQITVTPYRGGFLKRKIVIDKPA